MWTRSQETEGTCRFVGRSLMTRGVSLALTPTDLVQITTLLQHDVEKLDGLDYLQVFEAPDGRVVWAIDDGEHWTLLLPSEY